jgi:hypothetical protein
MKKPVDKWLPYSFLHSQVLKDMHGVSNVLHQRNTVNALVDMRRSKDNQQK